MRVPKYLIMKTLFFKKETQQMSRLIRCLLLFSSVCACTATAQEETLALETEPETTPVVRPEVSDATSLKLIQNYRTVTGGTNAHEKITNIVATGKIVEAGKIKSFVLIETNSGKRKITYTWRLLGRDYERIVAYDGEKVWSQEVRPKEQPAKVVEGQDALHFVNQRWCLQPLVDPRQDPFVFKYQGLSKVYGRPAYIVIGYGIDDERSWFYFDTDKFLLTRWGGLGTIAGVKEYLDYSAKKFSKVNGVLLPKEIDLLAENEKFGTITFDTTLANQKLGPDVFKMPPSKVPVLRQATN